MMPEEWPIALEAGERHAPARAAGRGRLSTVRRDFFLDPAERLTEQERALMTAMLHCLVADVLSEIRATLPRGWVGANDDDGAVIAALTRAGLLDDTELMALLLRRADEERIGTAARTRSGRRDARALQGLVSHEDAAVSAAAMALILARGRRRDRFGQCLAGFDDLSREAANRLVQAIAAALRREVAATQGFAAADSELSSAAGGFLARQDPSRSIEALTGALVATLDAAGALSDEFLQACAHEGEVGFLAEVLGRRSAISGIVAFDELLSGNGRRIMALMRVAGFPRGLVAGVLASIGDLLGIADPGAAIEIYEGMTPEDTQASIAWLSAAPTYRQALDALDGRNG
jgi:hypothetical protein